MEMQSYKLHVFQCQSQVDNFIHILHADAELIFGQSGSDICVSVGSYIRVDTESHIRYLAFGCCQFIDYFQFGNRLHIETKNVVVEP